MNDSCRFSLLLFCGLLALVASAHPTNAATLPVDRTTVWDPGIPGGVPVRATVCATVSASTYGNGTSDASAGIQSAINGCPVGQVVRLSAGKFLINNNYLLIWKGITVRGAGAGATILERTNGAKPNDNNPEVRDPVFIIGPSRWNGPDDSTSRNLTVDAAKGSYSVTVANGGGIAAGQFVKLDEDHYNTASWRDLPDRNGQPTSVKIWASDKVTWQKHNPPVQAVDDPLPAASGWFGRLYRPIAEIKEVASVSGNVVTFTTPLHIEYRVSHAAQLTRFNNVHTRNAGVEDLTVKGGGDGNIRFESAAYSWVKNVEDTAWFGEGVAINNSFRIELRDSYIHDAVYPNPGGGAYAISLAHGSSEVLVENNIVVKANKVMVSRSSGAGSVVGYNYTDDGYIGYNPDWVEVGINGSHMAGPHHMLFEGNYSFNYDSDNTHGGSIYQTVFRNHLSGFRRSFPGLGNARAGGLMYGSWWHSFVGNVMGTEGRMSGWVYEDTGSWSGSAIWKLGYDPSFWEQAADPKVLSTVIREGNFDYVTNEVHWDSVPQTIPDSLYLTSKPAFFASLPWPWVDPTGATKLHTLPAKARYDAGTPNLPPPSTRFDLNGDQLPDILWCEETSGALYAWLMDGAEQVDASYLNVSSFPDTRWRIRGIADFNYDGKADILWHDVDGNLYVWFMDGTTYAGGSFLTPASVSDTEWQIQGVGDLNGDGKSDIVWRHAEGTVYVWFMDGTSRLSGSYLTPSLVDVAWRIRGIDDFNGDGQNDILWHHTSGGLYVWFMDGVDRASGSYLTPSSVEDTGWQVARVADADGDGQTDILWFHDSAGSVYIWYMMGAEMTSGSFLTPSQVSPSWQIAPR